MNETDRQVFNRDKKRGFMCLCATPTRQMCMWDVRETMKILWTIPFLRDELWVLSPADSRLSFSFCGETWYFFPNMTWHQRKKAGPGRPSPPTARREHIIRPPSSHRLLLLSWRTELVPCHSREQARTLNESRRTEPGSERKESEQHEPAGETQLRRRAGTYLHLLRLRDWTHWQRWDSLFNSKVIQSAETKVGEKIVVLWTCIYLFTRQNSKIALKVLK